MIDFSIYKLKKNKKKLFKFKLFNKLFRFYKNKYNIYLFPQLKINYFKKHIFFNYKFKNWLKFKKTIKIKKNIKKNIKHKKKIKKLIFLFFILFYLNKYTLKKSNLITLFFIKKLKNKKIKKRIKIFKYIKNTTFQIKVLKYMYKIKIQPKIHLKKKYFTKKKKLQKIIKIKQMLFKIKNMKIKKVTLKYKKLKKLKYQILIKKKNLNFIYIPLFLFKKKNKIIKLKNKKNNNQLDLFLKSYKIINFLKKKKYLFNLFLFRFKFLIFILKLKKINFIFFFKKYKKKIKKQFKLKLIKIKLKKKTIKWKKKYKIYLKNIKFFYNYKNYYYWKFKFKKKINNFFFKQKKTIQIYKKIKQIIKIQNLKNKYKTYTYIKQKKFQYFFIKINILLYLLFKINNNIIKQKIKKKLNKIFSFWKLFLKKTKIKITTIKKLYNEKNWNLIFFKKKLNNKKQYLYWNIFLLLKQINKNITLLKKKLKNKVKKQIIKKKIKLIKINKKNLLIFYNNNKKYNFLPFRSFQTKNNKHKLIFKWNIFNYKNKIIKLKQLKLHPIINLFIKKNKKTKFKYFININKKNNKISKKINKQIKKKIIIKKKKLKKKKKIKSYLLKRLKNQLKWKKKKKDLKKHKKIKWRKKKLKKYIKKIKIKKKQFNFLKIKKKNKFKYYLKKLLINKKIYLKKKIKNKSFKKINTYIFYKKIQKLKKIKNFFFLNFKKGPKISFKYFIFQRRSHKNGISKWKKFTNKWLFYQILKHKTKKFYYTPIQIKKLTKTKKLKYLQKYWQIQTKYPKLGKWTTPGLIGNTIARNLNFIKFKILNKLFTLFYNIKINKNFLLFLKKQLKKYSFFFTNTQNFFNFFETRYDIICFRAKFLPNLNIIRLLIKNGYFEINFQEKINQDIHLIIGDFISININFRKLLKNYLTANFFLFKNTFKQKFWKIPFFTNISLYIKKIINILIQMQGNKEWIKLLSTIYTQINLPHLIKIKKENENKNFKINNIYKQTKKLFKQNFLKNKLNILKKKKTNNFLNKQITKIQNLLFSFKNTTIKKIYLKQIISYKKNKKKKFNFQIFKQILKDILFQIENQNNENLIINNKFFFCLFFSKYKILNSILIKETTNNQINYSHFSWYLKTIKK